MILKSIFTCLLTFILISSTIAQNKITEKLIGRWEGIDNKKEFGGFDIIDSVNIILSIPDQQLPPGTYYVDTTKNPIWFDVTIGDKTAPTLKGLIAFIDERTIKWQIFLDGKRPDKFIKETGDNTMTLKKKYPKSSN